MRPWQLYMLRHECIAALHFYSSLWLRSLNPSSWCDGAWPGKMPVPLTPPASSAHGAGACHLGSGPSNFSAMAPWHRRSCAKWSPCWLHQPLGCRPPRRNMPGIPSSHQSESPWKESRWSPSHVCSGLEALPHFGVKQIQLIYAQKWDMSALLFRTGSICCVVVFCCFVLIHRTKWCSFAGHAKIFLEQTWRYLMISHLEVKYIIWWFQTWTLFSIAYGLLSFPLTNSYVSRWLFHQQPVILW